MQMVDTRRGHFYIYEPVQLLDKNLVVPVFFYQSNNKKVYAKCLEVEVIKCLDGSRKLQVPEEPPFEAEGWGGRPVEDFWRPFEEIEWEGRGLLSAQCGEWLYRE